MVEPDLVNKVHYNALFGDGKREEKLSTQSRSFGSRDAEREQRKTETRSRRQNAPPGILQVNEPDRFVSG
jgi:hypothetical protein